MKIFVCIVASVVRSMSGQLSAQGDSGGAAEAAARVAPAATRIAEAPVLDGDFLTRGLAGSRFGPPDRSFIIKMSRTFDVLN